MALTFPREMPCHAGLAVQTMTVAENLELGAKLNLRPGLLLSVAANIGGKTLCPFGDAEIAPVISTISSMRAPRASRSEGSRAPSPISAARSRFYFSAILIARMYVPPRWPIWRRRCSC